MQLLVVKRSAPTQLAVTVTSPKRSDRLGVGKQATTTWETVGTAISHKVEIATDGGDFSSLGEVSGVTKSFTFTVPRAKTARIRVTAVGETGLTASGVSNTFEIFEAEPPPDVTLPQVKDVSVAGGAKKVKRGSTVTIAWQSSDDRALASHTVKLSLDGGTSFATLATGLPPNASSYQWAVASSLSKSKNAVIKVEATDASGNNGSATSATFKVK